METRANYVAVGAFVLVLLLGAAGVLIWLVGGQFGATYAYYEISFAGSVSGLDLDSAVRYNGVPVGKVSEIDIDQLNPNHIRVIVALDPVAVIRSDAVATLKTPLVSGGATIEITGGSNSVPPFPHRTSPPFPFIQSQSSGLESVFDKAPEAVKRLIEIEDQIKVILNEKNEAAIAETLENIRVFTGALAAHSGDIDTILKNTTRLSADLDDTAKAATDTVRQVGGTLTKVDNALGKVDTAIGHGDVLIGHTDKLIGNVDGAIAENRPGIKEFTSRGLTGVEQLIGNANDLIIKLSRVADELQRDPSRFLFGDQNKGYQPK